MRDRAFSVSPLGYDSWGLALMTIPAKYENGVFKPLEDV